MCLLPRFARQLYAFKHGVLDTGTGRRAHIVRRLLNRALLLSEQAFFLGLFSYVIGMTICTIIAQRTAGGSLSIAVPGWLYALMLAVTLGVCGLASLTSITKVLRLSPAAVFGKN